MLPYAILAKKKKKTKTARCLEHERRNLSPDTIRAFCENKYVTHEEKRSSAHAAVFRLCKREAIQTKENPKKPSKEVRYVRKCALMAIVKASNPRSRQRAQYLERCGLYQQSYRLDPVPSGGLRGILHLPCLYLYHIRKKEQTLLGMVGTMHH